MIDTERGIRNRYVIEIRENFDAGFVFDTKYFPEKTLYTDSKGVIYYREFGGRRKQALEWLQERCDHLNIFDKSSKIIKSN